MIVINILLLYLLVHSAHCSNKVHKFVSKFFFFVYYCHAYFIVDYLRLFNYVISLQQVYKDPSISLTIVHVIWYVEMFK